MVNWERIFFVQFLQTDKYDVIMRTNDYETILNSKHKRKTK